MKLTELSKYRLNKVINLALFVLFFIMLEMSQFFVMYGTCFPKFGGLDIFLIICLGSLIFLIPSVIFDWIYLPILYIFQIILSILNVTFYEMFGTIFSLTNLAFINQGLEVAKDAASFDVGYIVSMCFMVLLFGILLAFFGVIFHTNKKQLKQERRPHFYKRLGIMASLVLCLNCSYGVTIISLSSETVKSNDIMLKKVSNFEKYGSLSYYLQEINYILNNEENVDNQKVLNYFNQPFNNDSPYKGLLKDYNVFTIMIETGDDLMLNETLAPNLYSLLDDGVNMVNNFSKNKTNISEFIGITGSSPIAGILSKYKFDVPFSIPELLNDSYHKSFIHPMPTGRYDVDRDIYKRDELMKKLNFDDVIFFEDMFPNTPGWGWGGDYVLDSLSLTKAAEYLVQDFGKPFYSFFTSLSMHGPYVHPKNSAKLHDLYYKDYKLALDSHKFINPLAGTENEDCIENYMLAVMDFDKGLGNVINLFKQNNIYDKTLFVLYGDHEIYYASHDGTSLNRYLSGHDEPTFTDIYQTVMAFSNPKLKAKFNELNPTLNQELKAFTSPYNIVPSILDLLGVKYNSNFYMAPSIFNKDIYSPSVFYSLEMSAFFNNDFWSVDDEHILKTFNSNADEQVFLKAVANTIKKESMLDEIYKSNYFINHPFNDFLLK